MIAEPKRETYQDDNDRDKRKRGTRKRRSTTPSRTPFRHLIRFPSNSRRHPTPTATGQRPEERRALAGGVEQPLSNPPFWTDAVLLTHHRWDLVTQIEREVQVQSRGERLVSRHQATDCDVGSPRQTGCHRTQCALRSRLWARRCHRCTDGALSVLFCCGLAWVSPP